MVVVARRARRRLLSLSKQRSRFNQHFAQPVPVEQNNRRCESHSQKQQTRARSHCSLSPFFDAHRQCVLFVESNAPNAIWRRVCLSLDATTSMFNFAAKPVGDASTKILLPVESNSSFIHLFCVNFRIKPSRTHALAFSSHSLPSKFFTGARQRGQRSARRCKTRPTPCRTSSSEAFDFAWVGRVQDLFGLCEKAEKPKRLVRRERTRRRAARLAHRLLVVHQQRFPIHHVLLRVFKLVAACIFERSRVPEGKQKKQLQQLQRAVADSGQKRRQQRRRIDVR